MSAAQCSDSVNNVTFVSEYGSVWLGQMDPNLRFDVFWLDHDLQVGNIYRLPTEPIILTSFHSANHGSFSFNASSADHASDTPA